MRMLEDTWSELTVDTIVNCFKKAGLSQESQQRAINDEDDPFAERRLVF